MNENSKQSNQSNQSNVIKLPPRFFVFVLLLSMFIVLYIISGWTMSLYFLTFGIIFSIFFDIVPYKETYGNDFILNPKKIEENDCEFIKDKAKELYDNYLKCKDKAKPRVICPPEFRTSINIKDYADNHHDLIQDEAFLLKKEPQYKNTVCGLVPGHAFKDVPQTKTPDLTDKELIEAMNKDVKLQKIQNILENKIITDPLDLNSRKELKRIEKVSSELKPSIIYALRSGKKDGEFIKNAFNN